MPTFSTGAPPPKPLRPCGRPAEACCDTLRVFYNILIHTYLCKVLPHKLMCRTLCYYQIIRELKTTHKDYRSLMYAWLSAAGERLGGHEFARAADYAAATCRDELALLVLPFVFSSHRLLRSQSGLKLSPGLTWLRQRRSRIITGAPPQTPPLRPAISTRCPHGLR